MATDAPRPAIYGMGVGAVAVAEAPVDGQRFVTIMPFISPVFLPVITASVSVSVSVSVVVSLHP